MNGIQIESVKSATCASSTCDEIKKVFIRRGVLRRADKAATPVRLAA